MQPANRNLLSPLKFSFSIEKLPYVTYFGNGINLPGITVPPITTNTPFNPIHFRSDRIDYEDLRVSFLVDEDFYAWQSIFIWQMGLGFPDSFDQYKDIIGNDPNVGNTKSYSDITILLRNSNNNPKLEIKFESAWPTHLSGIELATNTNDVPVLQAVATFKYLRFKINRV